MGKIVSFLGSFIAKWGGAIVRFGVMLGMVIFFAKFAVPFFVDLMDAIDFTLSRVNALIDYINSYAGNTDELITLFFNVLKSIGFIDAFRDAYTLFKPIFFTLIVALGGKVVMRFLSLFARLLNYLFISRID
jgi:hypothetical protein